MICLENNLIPQNEEGHCYLRSEGSTARTRLEDVQQIVREKIALSAIEKDEVRLTKI